MIILIFLEARDKPAWEGGKGETPHIRMGTYPAIQVDSELTHRNQNFLSLIQKKNLFFNQPKFLPHKGNPTIQ